MIFLVWRGRSLLFENWKWASQQAEKGARTNWISTLIFLMLWPHPQKMSDKKEQNEDKKKRSSGDKSMQPKIEIKCNVCTKTFTGKSFLNRHIKSVHEKPYKCQICSASFGQSESLRTHIQTIHENLKPFGCPVCSTKFGTKGYLTTHVKIVHEKLNPFKCQICSA